MTRNGAEVGRDGWVSAKLDGDVSIHVRVTKNAAGRVVVTGVLVEAEEVTTDTLRELQPARVVAAARSVRADAGATIVAGDALVEVYAGADDSETTLGELRARGGLIRPERRSRLGRPDGQNPDEFYARVATAYRSAATESSRPAVLLAAENDVPVETARRWIKEARRRGHLAPGTKGRAG